MNQLYLLCERVNYKHTTLKSSWIDYFEGEPKEFVNKKVEAGFNYNANFYVRSSLFEGTKSAIRLDDSEKQKMQLLVEVTTFSNCNNEFASQGGAIYFYKGLSAVLSKVCSYNSKCKGTSTPKGEFCFIELSIEKGVKNELHYVSVNQDPTTEASLVVATVHTTNGVCWHENMNITGNSCKESAALYSYAGIEQPYKLEYSSVAKNTANSDIVKLRGVDSGKYTIAKCNIISNSIENGHIISTFLKGATIRDSCFIDNKGTLIGGNPIPNFVNCSVNLGKGYNTLFLNPLLGYQDQGEKCVASYDAVGTITVLLEKTEPVVIDPEEKKTPTAKMQRGMRSKIFSAFLITLAHTHRI